MQALSTAAFPALPEGYVFLRLSSVTFSPLSSAIAKNQKLPPSTRRISSPATSQRLYLFNGPFTSSLSSPPQRLDFVPHPPNNRTPPPQSAQTGETSLDPFNRLLRPFSTAIFFYVKAVSPTAHVAVVEETVVHRRSVREVTAVLLLHREAEAMCGGVPEHRL